MNKENLQPQEELNEQAVDAVEEVAEEIVEEAAKPAKKLSKRSMRSADVQRRLRHGRFATVITIAVIVVTLLLNVVFAVLGSRFPLTIDLSPDKLFTLSEESIEMAKSITKPVEIVVFSSEETFSNLQSDDARSFSGGHEQVGSVLSEFYNAVKQYNMYSDGKVTTTYFDMNLNPAIVNTYTQKYELSEALKQGDILFISGDRCKVANMSLDLFTVDYSSYYSTGELTLESSNVEKTLATKIKAVQSETAQVVTFFIGHNEDSQTISGLQRIYEANGFDVEEVNLTRSTEINVNTVCAVIAAPTTDYSTETIERLRKWLDNDGKEGRNLIVLAGATANCPNLYEFLEVEYGMEVTDNIIVETDPNRIYAYYKDQVFADIPQTDYTANAYGTSNVLVQTGREIKPHWSTDSEKNTNYRVDLLTFADTAELVPFAEYEKAGEDQTYTPQSEVPTDTVVGMSIAIKEGFNNSLQKTTITKVAVCGSGSIPYTSLTSLNTIQNEALFLNVMNSITGAENTVNISSKNMQNETVQFSTTEQIFLGLGLFTVVLPLGLLIAGLVVFLRRRHL